MFGEDETMNSEENGGLFGLTEVKVRERPQQIVREQTLPSAAQGSIQTKLISSINLSQYSAQSYSQYGPFLPGYAFYELLIQSKHLDVLIPDTVVVNHGTITHLYNGRHGHIEKSVPNFDTTESWISKVMSRFLAAPTANPHSKTDQEPLSLRTVGIVKKQLWKTHVMNHTETLSALGVQAYLVQCLKAGNNDSFVLQKFIKCRGRRPCFNRIFWRAGADTVASNRTLAGWNITSHFDFEKNPEQPRNSSARKLSLDDDARRNLSHLPESDEQFVQLLRSMTDLNSAESASIKMRDSQNYRSFGYRNICCLTDEADDVVTPEHCDLITVTKLSSRAIEGTMTIIDKVVLFLENLALRKYGCSISVLEIVCDFIRDEDDKFYLTQIKGLRLSPSSLESIKSWSRRREAESDLEEEDKVDAAEEYRKKVREAMARQKDSMGYSCRLCGMIFPEGAEVDVPSSLHPSRKSVAHEAENEKQDGTKKIPCHGYRVTDRMAYALAAIYRDSGLRITPYAREMLVEEAQHTQVGLTKPPVSLADGTQLKARRKRLGMVDVCVHCIQIYEELSRFKTAAHELHTALGIGPPTSPAKLSEESKLIVEGGDPARTKQQHRSLQRSVPAPPAAPPQIRVGSLLSLPQGGIRDYSHDIETHCRFHGQTSPWTSAHFESGTEEWRLLIMFHNLMDVKCNPIHPLHNAYGHLTYGLGQAVQSLPFRNIPDEERGSAGGGSSLSNMNPFSSEIVSVRQCRLHYLYASKAGAMELFSQKRLEFHLHFSPDDTTANTPYEELQLEASFFLDLSRLNWFSGALSTGREKIDVLVPVETKSLGTIVTKISVGIINADLPNLNEFTFHKEKRCFWPPPSYHDTQPLPEAWLAMMISKDRSHRPSDIHSLRTGAGARMPPSPSPSQEKDRGTAMLMLKYTNFIRKVFDDQPVLSDGTTNGPKFLLDLYQTLTNERLYLAEEEKLSLDPLHQALQGLIDEADIETRVTCDSFIRLVELFIAKPKMQRALTSPSESGEEDDSVGDLDPSKPSPRATDSPPSRRTVRMNHSIKAMKSNSISKTNQFDSQPPEDRGLLDNLSLETFDPNVIGLVASPGRKERRLKFLEVLFETVTAEVIDVAELRQYLVEESERLSQVLSLVKSDLMKLPTISSDYASSAKGKFSLIRSVLCCHLLTSSEKLTKLYHAYDTLGVSITSRVGLLTSCDSCWRSVALARATSDFNPVVQELLWLAKKQYPPDPSSSTTPDPPSLITLACDVHGRGSFYLADLCCVQCEKEIYSSSPEPSSRSS